MCEGLTIFSLFFSLQVGVNFWGQLKVKSAIYLRDVIFDELRIFGDWREVQNWPLDVVQKLEFVSSLLTK